LDTFGNSDKPATVLESGLPIQNGRTQALVQA